MIANAMFFGQDSAVEQPQVLSIGPLKISLYELWVSLVSVVIVVPVITIVIQIFRRVKPATNKVDHDLMKKVKMSVSVHKNKAFDVQNIGYSNSCTDSGVDLIGSTSSDDMQDANENMNPTQMNAVIDDILGSTSPIDKPKNKSIEKLKLEETEGTNRLSPSPSESEKMRGRLGTHCSTLSNRTCTQVMLDIESGQGYSRSESRSSKTEDKISDSVVDDYDNVNDDNNDDSDDEVKGWPRCCLPVGWVLCVLGIIAPGFFLILYSMDWGKDKSNAWLASFFLSFFESMFMMDPLKVNLKRL